MLSAQDKEKIQTVLHEVGDLLKEGRPLNKNFSNEDLRVIYSLAYTLYQGNDFVQARSIFQQLASLKPFEQKYWLGLASCWQVEKRYHEALKGWAMAALLNERDPTPHFHATECYLALDDQKEGSKAFAACQKRITEKHQELKRKLENLRGSFTQEAQRGA